MTRANRVALVLVITVTTFGCDRHIPTTPTTPTQTMPLVSAVPLPRQLQELDVVGRVVDSADRPVASARVTQWDSAHTTLTDVNGGFHLPISVAAQDRSFWVTVEKAGYETSELNRSVDTASSTVLRLRQVQSVGADESVHLTVNPDDSACGYHWGYICRRVRIRSQSPGTLMVEVISDGPRFGVPVGNVGFPQRLESRISMPVSGGSEVSVEIATGWPLEASTGFSLNTSSTPAN